MLIICFFILLIAIRWLIKDPHKTILVYAIFNIFLQDYVCIRFEPPSIMLRLLMDIIIICYFYKNRMIDFNAFPLRRVFIFLFFIVLLGIIVSPLSLTITVPAAIGKITPYLIVVLFYSQLKTKEDTEIAYKAALWSFGILCSYAVIEFLLQENPVEEYVQSVVSDSLLVGKLYLSSEFRYISVRCSSLLEICIAWGGYVCLIVACFFCLSIQRASKFQVFIMIALLVFNVFISGSRAPMLYLAVIAIGYFLSAKISIKLLLLVITGAIAICNQDILLPIISSFSDNNNEVGGSSISMRLDQYAAVSSVISNSPLWGFGIKGYLLASEANSDILGAESIWLQQLINSGIMGVLYQIFIYIAILRYMLHRIPTSTRLSVFVMVLGWVAFCSLTSSPGLTEPYFLTICILVVRYLDTHNYITQKA